MKNLILLVLCCWHLPLFASQVPDLEAVMKNMGFQFRQAATATAVEDIRPHLTELVALTKEATQAHFPEDKAQLYRKGLDLVLVELQAAKTAADANDFAQVQLHLQQVDKLRKQYHKERRSSIWKLLFG